MSTEQIELLASTGIQKVDTILRGVIGICQMIFPGRIRSYLLEGSYSDGSAVQDSDIDIAALFKGHVEEEEWEKIRQLRSYCSQISSIRVDLDALDEERILTGITAGATLAIVLYGDKIPDDLPPQPLEKTIRNSLMGAFVYMHLLRKAAEHLTYPLSYPDPDGEFFGYEQWGTFYGDPNGYGPGIRTLVNAVTMNATAIVALKARQQVGKKSLSVGAYRQYIGDEWSDFLEQVYTTCKAQWQYQLPQNERDRQYFRTLCERTLAFENHFLSLCRPSVLSALSDADDTVALHAVQLLRKIAYLDEEFLEALRRLELTNNQELRQSVREVLSQF